MYYSLGSVRSFGPVQALKYPSPDVSLAGVHTIVAIDVSGSTATSNFYFDTVAAVLANVDATVPTDPAAVAYVLWESDARFCSRAKVDAHVSGRQGSSGTCLLAMARLVCSKATRDGFAGRLVIVTDGQVTHRDVEGADGVTERVGNPFARVDVHLVSTQGEPPNLSVAAPFVRSTEFELHVHASPLAPPTVTRGSSRLPVDLSAIVDIDDFKAKYDGIHAAIMAQNLGRDNEAMHDDVLRLRQRLLREAAACGLGDGVARDDDDRWGVRAITAALLPVDGQSDYPTAAAGLRRIVDKYLDADVGADVTQLCERLLGLCRMSGRYDVSVLAQRTSLLARAPEQQEPDAVDVPPEQAAFGHECPVMMCEDLPVLLLCRDRDAAPLFDALDKDALDAIAANPLAVLHRTPLCERLCASIDSVVGFDFYQEAMRRAAGEPIRGMTSPFSRRQVVGAVVLGNNESCVASTSWALAQLTTGGKLLGNPQLWYLLVWHLVRRNGGGGGGGRPRIAEAISRDAGLDAHLRWRAAGGEDGRARCRLGLSGLPGQVLVDAPLGVALWHCAKTAHWYAEEHHERDRMRELWPFARPMLAALATLRLDPDAGADGGSGFTERRVRHLGAIATLLRHHRDGLDVVADRVRALTQAHVVLPLCGRTVFLDGAATPEQMAGAEAALAAAVPLLARVADVDGVPVAAALVALAQEHRQDKAGAFPVPKAPQPPAEWRPVQTHYSDEENNEQEARAVTPVSPATLRPLYHPPSTTDSSLKTWRDAAIERYGPLDKQLSLYGLFARFVVESRKLPLEPEGADFEEFALWCARAQRNRYGHTTLPRPFIAMFECLGDTYRPLVRTDSIDSVAQRMTESMPIARRERMEVEPAPP
jgi:hypothetical protein